MATNATARIGAGLQQKVNRIGLIARLREGVLNADDYAEVAKSRASLKVRIHNLREQGFVIRSEPLDELDAKRRPKVAYRLISAPNLTCPCCGGAL